MSISATGAREAYGHWHSQHGVDNSSNTPWYQQVKTALHELGGVENLSILDIGSGSGGLSCWIGSSQPRAARVVAADFSPEAVELGMAAARSIGVSSVEWRVEDIQAIREADASFDRVISCETIEHVPNPRLALRELARVLKPGGFLILTHPNYFSTIGLYRLSLWMRGRKYTEEGQPINHPLRSTQVRGWIRKSGLQLKPIRSVGHYSIIPGRLPRESAWLAQPRALMKWFGFHPIHVARK